MNEKINKTIDEYYSCIDKNILNDLCKNKDLKNLINLSTITDLYIFNKKNKKWKLKSKDKLLKECETIKKKEIKITSNMLANLAKLNNNYETTNIKKICDNLHSKIINLDNIANYIHNLDSTISPIDNKKIKIIDIDNNLLSSSDSFNGFIESYSNC
jgi:hypothetical protein